MEYRPRKGWNWVAYGWLVLLLLAVVASVMAERVRRQSLGSAGASPYQTNKFFLTPQDEKEMEMRP